MVSRIWEICFKIKIFRSFEVEFGLVTASVAVVTVFGNGKECKQGGAELCQAQVKLGLAWLAFEAWGRG